MICTQSGHHDTRHWTSGGETEEGWEEDIPTGDTIRIFLGDWCRCRVLPIGDGWAGCLLSLWAPVCHPHIGDKLTSGERGLTSRGHNQAEIKKNINLNIILLVQKTSSCFIIWSEFFLSRLRWHEARAWQKLNICLLKFCKLILYFFLWSVSLALTVCNVFAGPAPAQNYKEAPLRVSIFWGMQFIWR